MAITNLNDPHALQLYLAGWRANLINAGIRFRTALDGCDTMSRALGGAAVVPAGGQGLARPRAPRPSRGSRKRTRPTTKAAA